MLNTSARFALSLVALIGNLPSAAAQSHWIGWGEQVFNDGWTEEPFADVAAGGYNTVARRSDGSAVAWGNNVYNQCNVPPLPSGLTYIEVAVGGGRDSNATVPRGHSLARRSDGSVVAWGDNGYGQCNVPALPPGLSYVEIAAGGVHSLGRLSDGSLVAWGQNFSGQCNLPVIPPGLMCIEVAAGGLHSLVRLSDGSILAWGEDSSGQCNVPPLPLGLTYVEVAAGWYHSVARRSDGSVVAWGDNSSGQCNVPPLPPALTYVEIAAGGGHDAAWTVRGHTVARRSDGSVVAWGDNSAGQCSVPALPQGFTYVQIAAGCAHTVARRSDGLVVAWGENVVSQCNVPQLPTGLTYVEVALGGYPATLLYGFFREHAIARLSDGTVVAWGDNTSGQCNVPALPPGLTYLEVAAAWGQSVALRSDGSVLAWGGASNVPALPPGLTYVEVAAGVGHAAALRSDGWIVAWGNNFLGECNVPALPPGLTYVEVAAGGASTAARLSDGSVVAWGDGVGQLNVPALPPGLAYVEVDVGGGMENGIGFDNHIAARRSDGSVVVWGVNWGNVPALPPGLTYVEVAAGCRHTVARRSDGSVVAWGDNSAGQCNVPALPPGLTYAEIAASGDITVARVEPTFVVTPFCFGDSTQISCPCNNTGLPGHGCENSISTGGALLAGGGQALLSADSFLLTASNERPTAFSLFWQGGTEVAPRVFGDGVGCMGAPLKRLFFHNAVGGTVTAPQGADLSVSARSAGLGDTITPGTTRVYHVFYRDPDPTFCPFPAGSTFNTTNGLRVLWGA